MATLNEDKSGSSGLSLAVRLQEGSQHAWADLVELYGPLVASWAARMGLDQQKCQDVTQEVFLAVHRSIARFDPTRPGATFRGWLWRITRNSVLQSLRTIEPEPRGGSTANYALANLPASWPGASAEDPPSCTSDTTALVRRALHQIQTHVEPQTWQAFWRTAILGQSASEVAQQLGCTPAAVRKAKSRTLQRLRRQLGDQM